MKINCLGDFLIHIKSSNNKFCKKIIDDCGGFTFYIRALATQFLFFTLIYKISLILIPIKDFYIANGTVLLIVGFWTVLSKIFEDNIPEWINEFISGKIFYRLGLDLLNQFIIFLLIAHLIIIPSLDSLINLRFKRESLSNK